MAQPFSDPEACVDATIERVGKDIRLATPLAAGKPNHLLNAFYRRAKRDPSIELTILTALTLQRPVGRSDLERRFLGPLDERVFGDYPDLDYELDRVAGRLPANVRVLEFYFPAGKYAKNPAVQQDYISTNYTFVARDLIDRGVNVLAQQVAEGEVDGEPALSLSCNPDVTLDVMRMLRARADSSGPFAFVAQVNNNLPFMYGDAVVPVDEFDFVVRNEAQEYRVFGPPKTSVTDADYMIGLFSSALVRDAGELQVGIGALGDSLVYGLQLRHENNDEYLALLDSLGITDRFRAEIDLRGDTAPFREGLFAATEMIVDGFLHLYRSGIVKRRVYDDLQIQRLLNEGVISETVTPETLDLLLERGAIRASLSAADVAYLRRFGVFHPEVRLDDGQLVCPGGRRVRADLGDPATRRAVNERCLGAALQGGHVIHGGFFLGPNDFYQALHDMPVEERQLISMRSVNRVNQLYGHEEIDRLHRKNARFINTAMMVTALGAAVSDALDDGTVISGVGGQYNFVAMAHALPDGHSVIQVRSTRESRGQTKSNIVFNYGHVTIPRHLRDIVVSEYGIAEIRGKTDQEVIIAMLNICDSRFQAELMQQAKDAGKLRADHQIPEQFRHNLPERYVPILERARSRGLVPRFPFGTDLTDDEIVVGRALKALAKKTARPRGLLRAVATALPAAIDDDVRPYLARMGLANPSSPKEHLYARLLASEIRLQARAAAGPAAARRPRSAA